MASTRPRTLSLLLSLLLVFFHLAQCIPSPSPQILSRRNETSTSNQTLDELDANKVTPTFNTNILRGYNIFKQTVPDGFLLEIQALPRYVNAVVKTPEELIDIALYFNVGNDQWRIRSRKEVWGEWWQPEPFRVGVVQQRQWFDPKETLRITADIAIRHCSTFYSDNGIRTIRIRAAQNPRTFTETRNPLYVIIFHGRWAVVDAVTGKIVPEPIIVPFTTIPENTTTSEDSVRISPSLIDGENITKIEATS